MQEARDRGTPRPTDPAAAARAGTIRLADEAATARLGAAVGRALGVGDCVLLAGGLGAGKSALARAAIRACLGEADREVPSPSYTLVNVHEAAGAPAVWHADLYRLDGSEDAAELGLGEALDHAALIVEWPDRLGAALPSRRIEIALAPVPGEDGARLATVTAHGPDWATMLAAIAAAAGGSIRGADAGRDAAGRDAARAGFLVAAGWGGTSAVPLAGDASNRRYFRLAGARSAVLMDAAPPLEDVRPFLAVTDWLRGRGLSAPEVLAADREAGFLLLEDLGDALYARVAADRPAAEAELYAAAVDLLADHAGPPPERLGDTPVQPYNAAELLREARLALDWYLAGATGRPASADLAADWDAALLAALGPAVAARDVLVLRDYHAENLIWLPERAGAARVGLLDYQDALAGHPAYDLVSLLEDARRDTAAALRAAMLARFLARRPDLDPEAFRAAHAALGAQRNLKILGIFARLCLRDGKARYPALLPRVWDHLRRDLAHPVCAGLARLVARHLPAPEPGLLARLAAGAGSRAGQDAAA